MDTASATTELRLVRAFRAGDADAFRRLFDRVAPAVRARVRHGLPARLTRRLSISDVLQEVGVVAFERHRDFTGETVDDLRNWLLGIADMKVKNSINRHRNTQKRGIDCEVTRDRRVGTCDAIAGGPSPSQVAVEHELRETARRVLAELAPDHREVLRLVRFDGLSLTDAAVRMGRSYNAIRKLHARALYEFTKAFDAATRSRDGER